MRKYERAVAMEGEYRILVNRHVKQGQAVNAVVKDTADYDPDILILRPDGLDGPRRDLIPGIGEFLRGNLI